MKTDEVLVRLYAETYGWLIANVRPGERDGAAEVAEHYEADGCLPFTLGGAWRQREAVLRDLCETGLIVLRGSTRDRRCGLTWPGVCRAVALTVEATELPKAFAVMRRIADHAKAAGGPDVSPSGSVPEYLLATELGHWWDACAPGKESMMLARSKLFYESLPALAMRWLTVAADCHGRRWYKLTATGKQAANEQPTIPRDLPEETLCDFYLGEADRAWEAACRAKPRDTNAVHVGVSASRWWTAKGGAA